MEFCHLELELIGCSKEEAALHSDHCTCTQVQLNTESTVHSKTFVFLDRLAYHGDQMHPCIVLVSPSMDYSTAWHVYCVL